MCLYKGLNKHKIAQEDIVCYKTARMTKYELLTFFQEHTFELNVPITPAKPMSVEDMDAEHVLEGEVVHAFKNKELNVRELHDELDILSTCNKYCSISDLVLVKCIIPKGTVYYEDIPNMTCIYGRQYGATQIIPIEIVRNYTGYLLNHND